MLEMLLDSKSKVNSWKLLLKGPPPARQQHAMDSIDGAIYVFGGTSGPAPLLDLWCYLPLEKRWVQKASPSATYASRAMAFCTQGNKLYLHGGFNSGGRTRNLISYDTTLDQWAILAQASTLTERASHCMAAVGTILYVHGGNTDASNATSDFWQYNIGNGAWQQLASTSFSLQDASMVTIGTNLYLYGGKDLAGLYSDKIWRYNTVTRAWVNIVIGGPPGRQGHAVGVIGQKMYIAGGTGALGALSDFWEFDTTTFVWKTIPGAIEGRVWGRIASVDEDLYLFGGSAGSTGINNHLWRYGK